MKNEATKPQETPKETKQAQPKNVCATCVFYAGLNGCGHHNRQIQAQDAACEHYQARK